MALHNQKWRLLTLINISNSSMIYNCQQHFLLNETKYSYQSLKNHKINMRTTNA